MPLVADRRFNTESAKNQRQISLMGLLGPHWKALALGLISALGSVAADILQPLPLKVVIDNVLGTKGLPYWLASPVTAAFGGNKVAMLNFAVICVVLIAVLNAISSYVQSLSMTTVGQWVMHDLRSNLYHHIQRLSLSYHDRSQTGDLITRVTSDIDTIQSGQHGNGRAGVTCACNQGRPLARRAAHYRSRNCACSLVWSAAGYSGRAAAGRPDDVPGLFGKVVFSHSRSF